MNIEHELKSALRRGPAPEGFAARVMSAARREEALDGEQRAVQTPARWWRAAAAAVLLTAVLGGWAAHNVAERQAGERAKAELMLALHITGEKVHYAKTQVHGIGSQE